MKTIKTVLLAGLISSGFSISTEVLAFDKHYYRVKKPSVMSGEIRSDSAVIWGRCNEEKNAYMKVYVSKNKNFKSSYGFRRGYKAMIGPLVSQATEENDYTASIKVYGLQPNTKYHYRVSCSLNGRQSGYPNADVTGKFRTAPDAEHHKAIRFLWGADLAGQGWGRNPELEITNVKGDIVEGGFVIFDAMKNMRPDFVIHQGDNIYADGPIPEEKEIPEELGGGIWINKPAKDYVAITLDDFRENWKYNLGDKHYRRLIKKIPGYFQWDDHEVTNNWYPGEILTSAPYNGIAANVLAERAKEAFFEYTPTEGRRVYRKFQHGKHVELFLLDERSFRGPNTDNFNPLGNEMLGPEQLDWFKRGLKNSTATWKVISTHDPLGIVVKDGDGFDSFSNGQDEISGREVQLAEILKYIKDEAIKNVVFLTSDVHFTAAISYDPVRSSFQDFKPFYEFVVGPLHAGAFGPGELDPSFGAQYEYLRAPGTEGLPANSPPPYLQSFGMVEVNKEGELTVKLVDITGEILFMKQLQAE